MSESDSGFTEHGEPVGMGMKTSLSFLDTQLRRFDFGLGVAEEERAEKLHQSSIILDFVAQHAGGSNIFQFFPKELLADLYAKAKRRLGGMDAQSEAEYWPYEMSRLGQSHLIRDWYLASGLTCGTYGIGVHDGRNPDCLKLEEANWVFTQLPWLRCVTTAAQIRQAKHDGVIALYAHWQSYPPAPRDLRAIDVAYAKGLRSFQLTYNQMDHVGVGCTERVDAGLSNYGLAVVKHCNDIGMIVDVSHCGPGTTLDACRHSSKPVTANHTAAKGVYLHARGKSDDELRAIADTGGVIGVVAVPAFLTRAESPTIQHMLEHIDYIADLVGWRHVALGTDWPLQVPLDIVVTAMASAADNLGFREEHRLDYTARLRGFEDSRDLLNVTRGLVARGYEDEKIRGILGENALRVFSEVCG